MPNSQWTFITNHGLVLSYIHRNPKHTAREIANFVGITERTTHKIISDLEAAGYIERRKNGRNNVYNVHETLPLRHDNVVDVSVQDLLQALMNGGNESNGAESTAVGVTTS